MKIAILGGTGFIGSRAARQLAEAGHPVVVVSRGKDKRFADALRLPNVSFVTADLTETEKLAQAFQGCDAVAQCAGASQEGRGQTLEKLHVEGTKSVVEAAKAAGVRKVVLVSQLRARPGVRSRYYVTKWQGEEIVRNSGLTWVVLKPGMVFGKGGHLLERMRKLLSRMPFFASVGFREKAVRLVDVEDVARVICAALTEDRLDGKTCAILGPEEMPFSRAVRRIAKTLGRPVIVFPMPVIFHRALAFVSSFMPYPLISASQVEMLADGASEPLPGSFPLPDDLQPQTRLTEEAIRKGLSL